MRIGDSVQFKSNDATAAMFREDREWHAFGKVLTHNSSHSAAQLLHRALHCAHHAARRILRAADVMTALSSWALALHTARTKIERGFSRSSSSHQWAALTCCLVKVEGTQLWRTRHTLCQNLKTASSYLCTWPAQLCINGMPLLNLQRNNNI